MNLNAPDYTIETQISNLYATERWLLALCQERKSVVAERALSEGWLRFIRGSHDRCRMLRELAHLESLRITFDWIVPKCVLSYDFECLAAELLNESLTGEELAQALNKITRHIAIEYARLLKQAEARNAYSVVMGSECLLETMPSGYEAYVQEPLTQLAS